MTTDTATTISVTPGRTRAPRRRLRLAGAASLALAALGTPAALAAPPSPLIAMQQAINAAHSYRETLNITTVGGPAAGKTTITQVIVRHGHLLQVHATEVSQTAHGTTTADIVDNGKNTCVKVAGQSRYTCLGRSIIASVLNSAGPYQLATSLGNSNVHLTSAGTGEKLGKQCIIYTITYAKATPGAQQHGSGTFWIEVGANRPVEEDGVATGTIIKGSAPSTSTSQITWTNWDDPSLTVPTVPGE